MIMNNKILMLTLGFFLASGVFFIPETDAAISDYDSSYELSVKVNATTAITNVLVPLKIDTSLAGFSSVCCLFELYNISDGTRIAYIIDSSYGTSSTIVWANFTRFAGGVYNQGLNLRVFYNNNTAVSNQTGSPSPFNGTNTNGWNSLFTFQNDLTNKVASSRDGTNQGSAAQFVAGVYGTAYPTGDGARRITINNPSEFGNYNNDFTLSAWIRPNGTHNANGGGIIWASGNSGNIGLFSPNNDDVRVLVSDVAATPFDTTNVLVIGAWSHVVALKRGSTYEIWHNGTLIGSVTDGSAPGGTTPTLVEIGRRDNIDGRHYNGTIDNAIILKRALSADEIIAMFNATSELSTSALSISAPAVKPSRLWNSGSTLFSTNITVTNSTTSAAVGNVYFDVFGRNYTGTLILPFANSSGGGIFNLNFTYFHNASHGNYTVKQYATETISGNNQTSTGAYLNLEVLSGFNVTALNKNNGTAISAYSAEVSNGSFTRLFTNLNNQAYIPFDQLPTGSAANLTVFRNGFQNSTTGITANATDLNSTTVFISRLQEFRAIDNSTMSPISSFRLNATNGTFSTSTYSTSSGKILIPAEELPFGTNVTFLVTSTTYASNTTNISFINGSSEINMSFSLAVSRFTITVFDEITVQPIQNFTVVLNNGTFSSTTIVTGATFQSNTSILPVGATTVTVQHPNYVERNYFVTISSTSTLSLITYLLNTTSGVFYNFIVITGTGNPIEGARITVQKNFNGTITPVAQQDTDSSGTASFWMNLFTNYVVKVEKDGYVAAVFNQIPQTITSTTFVRLTATGVQAGINIGFNTAYSNISLLFLPRESFQNGSFTVQFTISDSAGALQRFGMNVSYMNQTNNSLILYNNQSVTGFPSGATLSFTVPNITGNWQVDAFFVKNNTQINLAPVFYTLFQRTGTSRINFNFNQEGSPSRFAFLLIMTIIAALVAVFTARFSLDAAVFMPLVIFGIATALRIMLWYEFLMILLPTIAVYLLWRRPI